MNIKILQEKSAPMKRGNKGLEKVCEYSERIVEWIPAYKKDLNQALKKCPSGIAIAANQVYNNSKGNVFAIFFYNKKVYVMPEYEGIGTKYFSTEKCLSDIDNFHVVVRYKKIKATYFTEKGKYITEILTDQDAIVFQHETDHLKGKPIWSMRHINEES